MANLDYLIPIPRGYQVHSEIPALSYRIQAGRLMVLNRAEGWVKRFDLSNIASARYPFDTRKISDYALIVANDSTIAEESWY
jgi:hypothetical protein